MKYIVGKTDKRYPAKWAVGYKDESGKWILVQEFDTKMKALARAINMNNNQPTRKEG